MFKKTKLKKYNITSPHRLGARRWSGQRIALLGGSFNPPHSGHMHIALTAMRQHKFNCVWWLVSPQNPLKSSKNNFVKRYKITKHFIRNQPKMIATDIETQLNIKYSYQTVEQLQKHFPKTKFTWIAGMDNAKIFHRWDRWKDLLRRIPFIFFNRPPNSMAMGNNAIRMVRGKKNVRWNLHGKTRNISSTTIRKKTIANFIKSRV